MHLLLLVIFRIVGEDDGGELFTPEQYEEYKKKVLPMVRTNKQSKQVNKQTNCIICGILNNTKKKEKQR